MSLKQREKLLVVKQNAMQLLELVNELLDLSTLEHAVPPGTSMDEKFLSRAGEFVKSNLGSVEFSVAMLADEMHLSRAHLLRRIKRLTGLTVVEFIKEMRLNCAADLLIQKADTVTQIAYKVGFSDQPYFTKCFKKRFGVTPSAYMNIEPKR